MFCRAASCRAIDFGPLGPKIAIATAVAVALYRSFSAARFQRLSRVFVPAAEKRYSLCIARGQIGWHEL